MRWLLYPLAVIGALTVLVGLAVLVLAGVARHGEQRKRQAWRDQYLLEVSPDRVAENPSLFLQFADAHGLRAPRGYRP